MKFFGIVTLALFTFCTASLYGARAESPFEGEWITGQVVEMEGGEPAPTGTEVCYPRWLSISFTERGLEARYRDQFGNEAEFAAAVAINNGRDLILTCSGTTKEAESFAPIHHVKIIDGKMIGVVLARVRLFEWTAEKQKTP